MINTIPQLLAMCNQKLRDYRNGTAKKPRTTLLREAKRELYAKIRLAIYEYQNAEEAIYKNHPSRSKHNLRKLHHPSNDSNSERI